MYTTVIGDNEDSRIGRKLLDYSAGHGIESFIHLTHCISKTRFGLRVVKEMTAVHVLPEIVLHSIYRHEDEHHHVLRMVFQEVKSGCGPLLVDFLHFVEHLSPPLVCRHEPEEADVMVNLTKMMD